MTIIKYTTIFAIIFSIMISFSCTTENSITGSSNNSLEKILTNPADDKDAGPLRDAIERIQARVDEAILNALYKCLFLAAVVLDDDDRGYFNKAYDFRDNYLKETEKGWDYIACYYLLSKYSIENNLVNKYYNKHYELLKNSVGIANELQYGTDANQIIISKNASDDLKDMLEVYREHPNHREIDDVLDYLEKDLAKYENQPKSVIAKDFK